MFNLGWFTLVYCNIATQNIPVLIDITATRLKNANLRKQDRSNKIWEVCSLQSFWECQGNLHMDSAGKSWPSLNGVEWILTIKRFALDFNDLFF